MGRVKREKNDERKCRVREQQKVSTNRSMAAAETQKISVGRSLGISHLFFL